MENEEASSVGNFSGAKKRKRRKETDEPDLETPKYFPFKKKNWKNPNVQQRGNHRTWPQLKQILQMENYSKYPVEFPTYVNIEASESVFPTKKYCDITGFVSPYMDPKTKLRFASAEVYQFIHKYLSSDDIEKYLTLRNAQVVLK